MWEITLQLLSPEPCLSDCLSSEIEQLHPKLSHMKGLHTPILPIQLMIKPLRRRFKYHFYGSKQTNDIGKVSMKVSVTCYENKSAKDCGHL